MDMIELNFIRSRPVKLRTKINRIILHAVGEYLHHEGEWVHYTEYFRWAWEYNGICYHYTVEPDGRIVKLLDESIICGHAKGHNTDSIGIALILPGQHTEESLREGISKQWITEQQYESLSDYYSLKRHLQLTTHNAVDNRYLSPGYKLKIDPGVIDLIRIQW